PRATRAATVRVYGPHPRHLVARPDIAAGRDPSVTTSDDVTEVQTTRAASGGVGSGGGDYDRAVQVLSADWVLPIEGEPIEDGAAPRNASPPGARPSATRATAARRRPRAPGSACARSSTSRSSAATRRRRGSASRPRGPVSSSTSPTAFGSASRRTRRTPARE